MPQTTPDIQPSLEPAAIQTSPQGRRWQKPVALGLVGLLLLGSGFALGNNYRLDLSAPLHPSIIPTSNQATNSPLFDEVEYLLKNKYLRANQITDQKLMYGAISGMVASAGDPYTSFFDPSQNKDIQSQLSGSYEGIGAELGYNKDKQLVIIAPLKDSPAAAAGIKAGDVIAKIDGNNSVNSSLDDAVSKIRGKAGTTVKLTLVRSDTPNPIDVTITRKQITVNSIDLTFKDNPNAPAGNNQIAYLRLSRFGDTTIQEWDTAVSQITAHGAKALVLDLRDNPGGYFDAAIHVGSEFFTGGEIVGQQDAQGHVQKFNVDHVGQLTAMPTVVLINGGSASAAEIVSGALKTRNRATLIGENSFGKGSVQQVIDLPQSTSLHVTIAKWLLPDGSNIDKVGIKPNQEVTLTSDDAQTGQDPQLDAAVKAAGDKIK